MLNKFIPGTVQFGMKYLIANRTKVFRETARTLIGLTQRGSIDIFDTAISYGNSEQILEDFGLSRWGCRPGSTVRKST